MDNSTCEMCGGNLIWDEHPMAEMTATCDTCGLKIKYDGTCDYSDCDAICDGSEPIVYCSNCIHLEIENNDEYGWISFCTKGHDCDNLYCGEGKLYSERQCYKDKL